MHGANFNNMVCLTEASSRVTFVEPTDFVVIRLWRVSQRERETLDIIDVIHGIFAYYGSESLPRAQCSTSARVTSTRRYICIV